ncbi:ATP-grasp domain-containing protein [archaeon]|nr:ATP-grasp domain-containing protein [archaeon]
MKWLIQPVKIEQQKIEELMHLITIAGINYDIVYPFEGQVLNPDKTPYVYDENETYFVCGSYPLTRNVYQYRKESVFSLEDYTFKDIMNIFESHNFVNCDAQIINSKDMKWEDEEYFIRPANDDKSFNGGIYNSNTFNYEGQIVVAKLKHISKEHRFFIIDGEIVTASLYKINGELSTSLASYSLS